MTEIYERGGYSNVERGDDDVTGDQDVRSTLKLRSTFPKFICRGIAGVSASYSSSRKPQRASVRLSRGGMNITVTTYDLSWFNIVNFGPEVFNQWGDDESVEESQVFVDIRALSSKLAALMKCQMLNVTFECHRTSGLIVSTVCKGGNTCKVIVPKFTIDDDVHGGDEVRFDHDRISRGSVLVLPTTKLSQLIRLMPPVFQMNIRAETPRLKTIELNGSIDNDHEGSSGTVCILGDSLVETTANYSSKFDKRNFKIVHHMGRMCSAVQLNYVDSTSHIVLYYKIGDALLSDLGSYVIEVISPHVVVDDSNTTTPT